jgi:hypothetical protein
MATSASNSILASVYRAAHLEETASFDELAMTRKKDTKYHEVDISTSDSRVIGTVLPGDPLPAEVILLILNYLPPKDLARACCVNKRWRILASSPSLWNAFDLKEIFPSLKIIDGTRWKLNGDLTDFGIVSDEVFPLNRWKDVQALSGIASSLIKKNVGVSILSASANVSLSRIVLLSKCPEQGEPQHFNEVLFF